MTKCSFYELAFLVWNFGAFAVSIDDCLAVLTSERIKAISSLSGAVSKCSIDCRFWILNAKIGLDNESGGGAQFYSTTLLESCKYPIKLF